MGEEGEGAAEELSEAQSHGGGGRGAAEELSKPQLAHSCDARR